MKRVISLFLSMCMVLTVLPVPMYAEEALPILGAETSVGTDEHTLLQDNEATGPNEPAGDILLPDAPAENDPTVLEGSQLPTDALPLAPDDGTILPETGAEDPSEPELSAPTLSADAGDDSLDVEMMSDTTVASGSCGTNATWVLDDAGTLRISGTGQVEHVEFGAQKDNIKTLIIEEGITSIGSAAFFYLQNLSSLTIADTVTEINSQAFQGCSSLTTLALPSKLERISDWAFLDCDCLQFVYIPASVMFIARAAFQDCSALTAFAVDSANKEYCAVGGVLMNGDQTSLISYPCGSANTSYVVPEGVLSIGPNAFYAASSLQSVSLPASLIAIGENAFWNCDNLASVSYSGTENLWKSVYVYEGNTPLLEATLTYGTVSTISGSCGKQAVYTFDSATGALTISGTGSVTNTGWYEYSDSIISVTIGAEITAVDWWRFSGDYPLLQSFTVESGNKAVYSQGGVLFAYNGDWGTLLRYPPAKENATYAVPENTYQIYQSAFYGSANLQEITIPTSVTSIEDAEFRDCHSLVAINVAEGNTTYSSSNGVLLENGMLLHYPAGKAETSYSIPNGTTSLWYETFGNCNALTELKIPLTVGYMDLGLFEKLPNLQSIVYAGTEANWEALLDGELLSNYTDATVTFENSMIMSGSCGDGATYTLDLSTGALTISGTGEVTELMWGNFCESITSVTIGADIIDIDWNLFASDYPLLQSFTVESGNEAVYSQDGVLFAYSGKSGLMLLRYPSAKAETAYTIPKETRQIRTYAFYGSANLQEISIPASVTSINRNAFNNCNALTAITVAEGNTTYSSDNGVLLKDGELLHYPAGKMESTYTIPNGTATIWYETFGNCNSLVELKIPLTVSSMDLGFFEKLPNLESIVYAGTEANWDTLLDGEFLSYYTDATVTFENNTVMSGNCGKNAIYTLDCSTGVLTVSGTGEVSNTNFENHSDVITSVIIEDGITAIGHAAFLGLQKLTSLSIADTVIVIDSQAFESCSSLASLVLPSMLETIESVAFAYCESLQTVCIPASVTYLSSDAFQCCSSLIAFTVETANTEYCAVDGVLMDEAQTSLMAYPCGSNRISYAVLEGIELIEPYAFYGAGKLQAVSLPASLTTIEYAAFYDCEDLSSVNYAGTEALWNTVFVEEENEALLNATFTFGEISTVSGSCGDKAFYSFDPATGMLTISGTGEATNSAWSNFNESIISVTISAEISDISWNLFSGDYPKLQSFTVESGNKEVYSQGDVLFAYNGDWPTLLRYPSAKEGVAYTIPEDVKQLRNSAFNGCSLTTISLPAACSANGSSFSDCTKLQAFTVYGKVNEKDEYLFVEDGILYRFTPYSGGGRISLVSCPQNKFEANATFAIQNRVSDLDTYAFAYCSGLTAVTIPNSISTISGYAFYYCTDLQTVTLPASITQVYNRAFYCGKKSSLTNVYYAGSEVMWNNIAIDSGNTDLTSAAIHYGDATVYSGTLDEGKVTWVLDPITGAMTVSGSGKMDGDSIWPDMSCLKKVIVEEGITVVDLYMLEGSSVEELIIPASVKSIYNNNSLPRLKSVTVAEDNPNYCSVDNVLFNKDKTTLYRFPCTSPLTTYAVPDSVTYIESNAFKSCTNLTEITIPGSVTFIGSGTFADCTRLTSIMIPESVTHLGGSSVFANCTSLETVTIAGPITTLYSYTFENCTALAQIFLPGSVANIQGHVFYNCSALETVTYAGTEWMWGSVTIGNDNTPLQKATVICTGLGTFSGTCGPNLTWTLVGSTGELTISGTGEMYNFDSAGNNTGVASPTDLMVYSNEENGETWHKYAKAVRTVTVDKGVTSLGSYAFYGCSAMTDVSLPSGLTAIGYYAFYGCSALTDISLPSGITEIGDYAFRNCHSLKSIHLPASLTYIDSEAFMNCTALTTITVDSANKQYCAVDGILMNKLQTRLLCYPAGRDSTSYTVPDGVSTINYYSFYGAANLESISLPASLTVVHQRAFKNCDNLATVSYAGAKTLWELVEVYADNDSLLNASFTYGTETVLSGSCGEGVFWSLDSITGALTITGSGATEDIPWPVDHVRTVSIGAGITGIHHRTSSYPLLESVTVEAGNPYLYSVDGVLYEGSELLRYPAQKQGTTFNVPEKVDTISYGAFNDCAYLQQVNIPAAIRGIDSYAFDGCTVLTQITVAEGNTTYSSDDGILLENGKLLYYPGGKIQSSYAVPSGTTELSNNQFGYCTALTELHIPFSVGYLSPGVFHNMPNLERIVYEGSTATWNALLEHWDLEDYTDAEVICTNTAEISGTCGKNLTWTLNSATGTLTVSGIGGLYGYDEWAAPWNSYRNMVFSIVVEEGVNSIGQSAFAHCHNATSISLPKSVTFIGQGAFAGCDSLPGFTVSSENSAYTVNDGILFSADGKILVAFPGGYAESTYTVPNSVTQIGSYAFKNCDGLKQITIPNSVTQIGEGAFSQCIALTKMSLPASVTTINYATFANCNSLKEVSIPETVTAIGGLAFRNCNNLSSVELPSGITSIGDSAFYYCPDLNAITLPTSLTSIGDSAFEDSGLRSIDIPDSVTEIGSRAFAWSALQTISLPSEIEEIQYSTFYGCRLLTSITIPEKVTTIEQQAFDGCTALTSVTIPLSLSEVYWDAFDGCSALATVTYAGTANDWTNIYINTGNEPLLRAYLATNPLSGPCGDNLTWALDSSGVLTISGEGAMDDFGDPGAPWHSYHAIIRSIVVEEGVTSICQNAFWDCSAVDSIHLPKSLTDIDSGAFADCTSLTGFTLADGNPAYQVDDGILFSADGKTLLRFPARHPATSYTIPNSVTAISYAAFNSCTSLKAVAIPETVTSIDTAAFEYCSNLSDVNIPSGVTVINSATFRHCENLTRVDLPDSITSIGQSAFADCNKLSDIQIPSEVTHIGGSAFSWCEALETIDLPLGLDIINLRAFSGCSSLSSVTIPSSVTAIDSSAFAYCSNLTSVRIEEGVTTISNRAFADCQNLREIHLPATLAVIDSYAFNDCSALETVHFTGTEALWNILEIRNQNDALLNAHIIFGNQTVLNGSCGDNLTWAVDLSTGILTVSGTGAMDENWEYRPWSLYADRVTHIVVEDGVTSLAEHAFQSFDNLTSVSLPNSLTRIGDYAFDSCSSLTTVNIPVSVTHIGAHAFSACSAMTSYTVATNNPSYRSMDGVLFTRDGATLLHFPIANGVTAYTVPDTVEVIAEDAFSDNRSLTTVTLPEGLKQIGRSAFLDCSKLLTVNIPASVASIDLWAFHWCSSLTGIYVADGNSIYYDDDGILFQRGASENSSVQEVQVVSSWGDLKLYVPDETEKAASDILLVYPSARNAKEYTVPDNVGSIDYWAFSSCHALKKVYLGANLVEGHSLFRMCGGLTAIEVDEENPVFYSIDGVLYRRWNDTQSELLCYPAAKADTAFTIPDNVTYAILNDPTYLTSLTVPISMQHLVEAPRNATIYYAGSETMWEAITRGQMYDSVICSGTAKVFSGTFGDSGIWTFDPETETLTLSGSGDTGDFQPYYAGDGSGVNCPPWYRLQYRHVVVEEGITRLGDFIFDEIHWFESISLPSTLTALGEYLKGVWWTEYTEMEIPAGITELCGNTFGNIKDITLSPNNTAFILEDGVLFTNDRKMLVACYRTETGTYAVPEGVETIGAYAFYNSRLNEIILPDSVTTIEEYAFYGCENLSTLALPSKVSSIGIGALLKSALEELTVGNNLMRPDAYWFVTEIGNTTLNKIYFSGTEAQWSAASADLSDYYPDVEVICTGSDEGMQVAFNADSNTLQLSGTEAGTENVMVAFYNEAGQITMVKTYTTAEVESGVTITGEKLDFSQHTIKIFQLDDGYVPVADAVLANAPFEN